MVNIYRIIYYLLKISQGKVVLNKVAEKIRWRMTDI